MLEKNPQIPRWLRWAAMIGGAYLIIFVMWDITVKVGPLCILMLMLEVSNELRLQKGLLLLKKELLEKERND